MTKETVSMKLHIALMYSFQTLPLKVKSNLIANVVTKAGHFYSDECLEEIVKQLRKKIKLGICFVQAVDYNLWTTVNKTYWSLESPIVATVDDVRYIKHRIEYKLRFIPKYAQKALVNRRKIKVNCPILGSLDSTWSVLPYSISVENNALLDVGLETLL